MESVCNVEINGLHCMVDGSWVCEIGIDDGKSLKLHFVLGP